jgi:hypothetical protein
MAATALRLNRPVRAMTEDVYDLGWEYPVGSSAAFDQKSNEYVSASGTANTSRIVVTTPNSPAWVAPTVSALSGLLKLQENWDSYGAKSPTEETVVHALLVLSQIMDFQSPVPSVVPLADGGLQFEWHRKQQDLEVVFPLDAEATFYYQHRVTGAEEEGFAADITKLANLLVDVS